jgi:adenylate kinase
MVSDLLYSELVVGSHLIAKAKGDPVVLLFFGPPGSGKGTQSKLITEWLHIPAISTGDLFRAEMLAGTPLGLAAKEIMSRGGLVPDDIVNRMLAKRLGLDDARAGFLLDGYPRTIPQAEFLDHLLDSGGMPHPTILHLEVPREVIVARLAGRRTCPACSTVYNIHFHPPQREGFCDSDGIELHTRDDDREDIVRARLIEYDRQTGPLIGYFQGRDYYKLDGNRPTLEVARDVALQLENRLIRVRTRRR